MISETRLRRLAHLEDALVHKASVDLLSSLVDELLVTGDRSGALAAFRKHAGAFAQAAPQTQRRLRALHERILWNVPNDALATNLPRARHVIVGRNAELAAAAQALRSKRIITLVGAGGAGKTRIALELGRRVLPEFSDGIWWIDLHGVSEGSAWLQQAAKAIGAQALLDEGALIEALDDLECLLIFDGCEGAAPSLAPVLERIAATSPRVRILATSRVPLGTEHEHALRVEPLSVPPVLASGASALLQSTAVQLFVERAATADPRFAITDENSARIGELCRRLDGLPLAIELAAAASSYVPLDEICSRIEDFRGGLRSTIAWSIDLLDEPEREVLLRLSLLPAAFGFQEACAAGGPSTQHALKRLIDASLLHMRVEAGGSEYYLLDSLREFVLASLPHVERIQAERRVLALYAQDTRKADFVNVHAMVRAGLGEADDLPAALSVLASSAIRLAILGHVDAVGDLCESAIVRAGMEHASNPAYIETVRALAWIENRRGSFRQAIARNEEAAILAERAGEAASKVRALSGVYIAAINAGQYEMADIAAAQALELSETLRDPELLAVALRCRAGVYVALGQFERAIPFFERLLTLDLERVPQTLLALSLHDYAVAQLHLEHFTVARTLARRTIEVSRSIGDYCTEADAQNVLGAVELADNRLESAFEAYREALALCSRPATHPITRARTLEGCAASGMRDDQFETVAQVLGAAEQLRIRYKAPRNPFEVGKAQALHDALRSRMGSSRFEAALLAGRTRSYRDACRLVETLQCGSAPPRAAARFACLTPREREIAEFVTAGASNREISERLHLSVRTVENHLAAIYKKLNIRTRSELISKP